LSDSDKSKTSPKDPRELRELKDRNKEFIHKGEITSNKNKVINTVVIEEEKNSPIHEVELSYNNNLNSNLRDNNIRNLNNLSIDNKGRNSDDDNKLQRSNSQILSNFLASKENEIILLFFINPDCGSEEGKKILNMGVIKFLNKKG